ncbi:MAG TPA: MerR family DNA-binding transcriptional regulator [Candidatus Marinimicrobia bacterium]|jgi:DNA-binding transcriptional MerR regulator|nr:MerR family DNA-binding transcriptional regulator [Candidatus Neomarinimicrobiota bacterium]HIM73656.1 MerR family DNA-binding transcriptional regulator [Candidatus Neomarinimicrobiota bacterium]|tara:strand:- start:3723 stop:4112 length:390 start_codon:yes stop_codon:yes gene_type:complete
MESSKKERFYTVPELSRELGLTERAIRFYESKGLLAPKRAGNTRIFSYKDRARLIIIMRAKKLGFSLNGIKSYLDLYDVDSNQRKQTKIGLNAVDERINFLEEQREEIKILLADLKEIKHALVRTLNNG